jgi:hypothetical protein
MRKFATQEERDAMIQVVNHGAHVAATDYWLSDLNSRGLFFLSINTGAFRLLMPDALAWAVQEFETAQHVIISRGQFQGQDAYEILFDDGTDTPFSVQVGINQADRVVPSSDDGQTVIFSAWIRNKANGTPLLAYEKNARFRAVETLPCLKSWE